MIRWKLPLAWAVVLAAFAGCVNLNVYVYFDEKKLQDAADKLVYDTRKEVLVDQEAPKAAPATAPKEESPKAPPAPPRKRGSSLRWPNAGEVLARLADALVPCAYAEEDDKYVNTDTPAIQDIKKRMAERVKKLVRYYDAGNVGEARAAALELRNTDGLSVKDKGDLRTLSRDENADRDELFREVAEANKAAESEMSKIRSAFAKAFRKRTNKGWWIQTDEGNWVQRGGEGDPYR